MHGGHSQARSNVPIFVKREERKGETMERAVRLLWIRHFWKSFACLRVRVSRQPTQRRVRID